jgi:tetratricopeptide (TPR) repeat protein
MRKQPEKALQEFGKAIAINPKCAWAYVERGILLLQGGDCDKALPDLNKGIQLGHRTPQVFFWRAMVFHVQKNEAKVIPDLEESARLDPTSSLAHLGLAWTLSTASDDALRDGRKALVHAQKGCELTDYKNPGALETLAAAHAECGNFRDAVRWQKEALQLYAGADILSGRIIPVAGNQTTELARRRLGSYERNMPTRE